MESVDRCCPSLVVLFKLRVVSLPLLGAVAGAFLGASGWPGSHSLLLLVITGATAASGAAGLNQYIERESDGTMGRTRSGPLPAGNVSHPGGIAAVGSGLITAAVLIAGLFNFALAFFLLLGAVIYVGVYTIWRKPRTLLNIVIGRAAGSTAVVSGEQQSGPGKIQASSRSPSSFSCGHRAISGAWLSCTGMTMRGVMYRCCRLT